MKAINFDLFIALSSAIIQNECKAEECNVCHPPCLKYIVPLNDKKYEVEFISGGKICTIQEQYKFETQIIIPLHEIEFYRVNRDLLT